MHYDYIIIGSGAGGAAAAWRLASAGSQVLLLEKGNPLPRDGSTLDVRRVIREGSFKSHEPWLDKDGRQFAPEEYFNLGGKTKWYGAALLRYSPREFEPDEAHQCLGWPIAYADLEPYYAEAEQCLGVRVFAPEPGLATIVRRLTSSGSGWRAESLPLALSAEITGHPEEAAHFDAFASVKGLKGDAESAFLQAARELPNLRVQSGMAVAELLGDNYQSLRLRGVMTEDGQIFEGRTVLLAAGALHSPRLLQQYLKRTGLEACLPCAAQVGRYYKQHLLTALVAFTPRRQNDLLRKTLVLLNERVPHSSVQPLGFDGELIGALMPALVPQRLATALGQYAYGFFLQTEDGSDAANRIIAKNGSSLPQMDYDPRRLAPAHAEHRRLVRGFRNALLRAGCLGFSKRIPLSGTAHACGSLVAGDDPASSVVDAAGKVHGMDNLYVVDGSVLPRSSRVNPSLTIYAWSLRVSGLLNRSATEARNASARESAPA
jgi:choline dehydrogenase-like flavoprotein